MSDAMQPRSSSGMKYHLLGYQVIAIYPYSSSPRYQVQSAQMDRARKLPELNIARTKSSSDRSPLGASVPSLQNSQATGCNRSSPISRLQKCHGEIAENELECIMLLALHTLPFFTPLRPDKQFIFGSRQMISLRMCSDGIVWATEDELGSGRTRVKSKSGKVNAKPCHNLRSRSRYRIRT